jgi:hypothetical protein
VRTEFYRQSDGWTIIESEFVFDIQLDPSLYSMEPPEDYTFEGTVEHTAQGDGVPEMEFTPYSCLNEVEKDGVVTESARNFFPSPRARRSEFPDGHIVIFDLTTGDELRLWPDRKYAEKHMYPNGSPAGANGRIRSVVKTWPKIGSGPENLGVKRIEDKECTGYHSTDSKDNDYTVWVDNQTNLPVRTEIIHLKSGEKKIESEFRYDFDQNPALYSLKPLDGYTYKEVVEQD